MSSMTTDFDFATAGEMQISTATRSDTNALIMVPSPQDVCSLILATIVLNILDIIWPGKQSLQERMILLLHSATSQAVVSLYGSTMLQLKVCAEAEQRSADRTRKIQAADSLSGCPLFHSSYQCPLLEN